MAGGLVGADPEVVAAVAEEGSDLAGLVVVVDAEALAPWVLGITSEAGVLVLVAEATETGLLEEHPAVVLVGDPVEPAEMPVKVPLGGGGGLAHRRKNR